MNLINLNTEMTEVQAKREAVHILEEEANQLACIDGEQAKGLPHRAKIAINREIARLRAIAKHLKEP